MLLRHYDGDGRPRFITFGTRGFTPVFTNQRFCHIGVETIEQICDCCAVELLAYVVMPEHVHLVIDPPVSEEVGELIGDIKRTIARAIHAELPADSPLLTNLSGVRSGTKRFALWQRRCFDYNCRTLESLNEKIEYCHWNPVNRGLVKDPGDYKWSSYHLYSEGKIQAYLELVQRGPSRNLP
jgi:putative transposase